MSTCATFVGEWLAELLGVDFHFGFLGVHARSVSLGERWFVGSCSFQVSERIVRCGVATRGVELAKVPIQIEADVFVRLQTLYPNSVSFARIGS